MEVETCNDDADHCTYMLYGIIQDDCNVPQSDVITTAIDFDELGTVCTADSKSLLPSRYPYVSFDGTGQIHEDNVHTDSHGVVVQDVIEEEVNVNVRGHTDDDTRYCVNSIDSGQIADCSETTDSDTYIEHVQNVIMSCCYMCGRKFTRLQTLKGHMKRQHGTVCDVSRVTEEMIPIATVCQQCGYIGTTQQATCLHIIRKHGLPVPRPPHQCKTNPQRLKLNRQRMAAQKAAYPPIACIICASEIGLLKNYVGHIKRYHQNDSKFAEALDDVRRIQFQRTRSGDGIILNCETCGESHDENRLLAHIRWKHGNSVNIKQLITAARLLIRSSKMAKVRCVLVSCPHCGRCLRQISLANHIKFYCTAAEPTESAGSVISTARGHVECTVCGKSMPRPKLFRHRRLVHHIGTYKRIETFMCEYCPREFTEAHQLRTHVQKHTGISSDVLDYYLYIYAKVESCDRAVCQSVILSVILCAR